MIQYIQETTDMNTEEVEYCPECGTPLIVKIEQRDGGYTEIVAYCEGCGYTETS
jgi:DNA-directed RNA polymerase subunit M/transcription elongation factor TFIIS